MSTIKVNKIENTSTADGGVAIDTDGHVTIDGQQLPTAGPLSNRNLVRNGAMRVNQRNTDLTATGFVADGWRFNATGLDQWAGDATSETDAPDGFTRSIKINTTTAETEFTATDELSFEQRIEAQNLQHLEWGTANAKSITLSFYVKAVRAGTYSIHCRAHDANHGYTTTYTVNAAGTWEHKTIVIPGNTGGTIADDNGIGIWVRWVFACGSAAPTDDVWDTSNIGPYASSSATAWGTSVNDYAQLAGVQLEVGSKSTPFEHRSYGDELAKCQRYYQVITDINTPSSTVALGTYYTSTRVFCVVDLKQTMRAEPSLDVAGDSGSFQIFRAGTNDICNAPTFGTSQNVSQVEFEFTSGVNTAGANYPAWIRTSDTTGTNTGDTAFIAAKAEL